MPAPIPINPNSQAPDDAAYPIAARTAVVAAVFSLVVAGVLCCEFARRAWKDPLEAPTIRALRAALAENPKSEALKGQIRDMDLQLRTEYMKQRDFAARGGALLFGGLVVFFAAAKWAVVLRRELPLPQPATVQDYQSQWTAAARWAVAGLAAALLATAGGLIVRYRPLPEWKQEQEVVETRAQSVPLSLRERAGVRGTRGEAGSRNSDLATASPHPNPLPEGEGDLQLRPCPSAAEIAKAWPRFRGPDGSGVAPYESIPDAWDAATGKNILWKTPVPMPGNNSPVVWGNRVFLSGADRNRREVDCFDADGGKLLWRGELPATAGSGKPPSEDVGYASPTVATDGRLAFGVFANGDVAAFDFAGRRVWLRSLGFPDNVYGHAASPTTFRDLLLVPMDQGPNAKAGKSKLVALDMATGKTVWERKRPVPNSWTSPIVVRAAGRDQLITAADPWVIAYQLPDGAELWRVKCLYGDIGPSPAFAAGRVYVAAETSPLTAIAADGAGDATKSKVLWTADEGKTSLCSPLATENFVFVLSAEGLLSCFDARRGEKLWEEDFDTKFKASPVMAGSRLCLVAESGKVFVVLPSAKGCKRIGRADLGEPCVGTPAFQPGRVYLRGAKHLFCVGEKP